MFRKDEIDNEDALTSLSFLFGEEDAKEEKPQTEKDKEILEFLKGKLIDDDDFQAAEVENFDIVDLESGKAIIKNIHQQFSKLQLSLYQMKKKFKESK